MRKRIFYPKLALGNLWRNRQTYLPYLLACVVSVFTFYTMVAINTNGALDGIRSESIVKTFTQIASIILALFCGVLIFYTNSFLVKRRKKELGLYSILGMEKSNIGFIMLFETFFIAVIALTLGIGLGLLLGRLLFISLLNLIRFPVTIEMQFSLTAVLITLALFGAFFLLALATNLLQVHIANPVSLLAGSRQGEKEPKAGWFSTLMGIAFLAAGYFTALFFTSPLDALMFFLLAVVFVIIGTYNLFNACSVAVLKLLRSNKKFYYRPNHFITVSGMIYRMKQNAAGLATICILSCMVLVTVSSTVSLYAGAEDSLMSQYPYGYSLTVDTAEDVPIFLNGAKEIAATNNVAIEDLTEYDEIYFDADETDGVFTATQENLSGFVKFTLFELLTLEDYNRNEGADIKLAHGDALILVTGGRYDKETLTLNGYPYRVTPIEKLGRIINGSPDLTRTITLVLPTRADADAIATAAGETEMSKRRSIRFDVAGTDGEKTKFDEEFTNFINTRENFAGGYGYSFRESGRASWYMTNGGFLFLGIYLGAIFMLATALIIYYKQISEGYDDAQRFEILQKVGMSEKEVKGTINRQILAVFFIPLAVSVIHVAVAFFPVSRVMIIFSVFNIPLLAASTAGTVLVYALVYLLVFRRTAGSYFKIVRRGV
jgi:putative ABC transport system permease protein